MFTLDNTENFTQEILDKMNEELEQAINKKGLNKDDLDYEQEVKWLSEKIFDKYC